MLIVVVNLTLLLPMNLTVSFFFFFQAVLKKCLGKDALKPVLFVVLILSANDVTGLRESEEKLKQQQQESARRENILVMRLATKEQEMQECTVSI